MSAGPRPSPEFLALQAAVTGRYVLDREIGRGGMGAVFLARDVALERPVAIKLLLPHLAGDAALRERFLREARTAAQLMHPNIVPIYAVEATDALCFFVMAYIDGETLSERVARKGPLPPGDAQRVLRDVAWALGYAHERGVIHRDVKPDNVLLEHASGRALVADFGIARVQSTQTLSDDGALVGTVQYMSPEQALGEPVDGRSDVYSLAATMYFALSGVSPVAGPNIPVMLSRLVQDDRPSVSLARPETPPALAALVNGALARDRAQRPESAAHLAAAVQELERSVPSVRAEVRWFVRQAEQFRVLLMLGIGGVGIGLALGIGGIIPGDSAAVVMVASIGGLIYIAVLATIGLLLQMRRQGVGVDELEAGVMQIGRESDQASVSFQRLASSRFNARLQGWIAMSAGGCMAALGVLIAVRDGIPAIGTPMSAFGLAFGVAGSTLLVNDGRRFPLIRRFFGLESSGSTGGDPLTRGLLSILRARVVRWLFRKRPTRPATTTPAAAPTATLLLQRVQDLLAQLPSDQRARIPDVLPVSAALERCAAALRARVTTLDNALAELGPAGVGREDFVQARDHSAERLATCVAALETLRTNLLRLTAGLAQADGLTQELERARALSSAIDAELHGQDQVRKLLG